MTTTDKCFVLKDADFDLAASVTHADNGQPAYVTIMALDKDQFITMTVADFDRMAAAIARVL
jgi:hypothetical protein